MVIYGLPQVRQTRFSKTGATRRAQVSRHQARRRRLETGQQWLAWRGIEDIECITPDFAGVPRGKMMPSKKFTSKTSLALPSAVFRHTISGEYPEETGDFRYDPHDGDLKLMPDLSTLSVVPWESDPTAQVICDLVGARQGHPPTRRATC
jgi:glutamine synthetase